MPSIPYWILLLPSALCLGAGAVVMGLYWGRRWLGRGVGYWRHRRSAWPRAVVALLLASMAQGCATSYKPTVTGPLPFAFTPSDEQCAQLLKEKRTYRATEKTATYVSGAGALLSVLFLGLVEEKAVPAASAGVTLLASGVGVFAGSQVESLDQEIDLGACLNRPPPPLPTLAGDNAVP